MVTYSTFSSFSIWPSKLILIWIIGSVIRQFPPQASLQNQHLQSNHLFSTNYNSTYSSSSYQRKHPLQSDIDERYEKRHKATSGTASETNSLVTEEDNSSLHDDNLDGGLSLPYDGEASGN